MENKRYQVFVSSTYADLMDERRAVIQALLEMNCIPSVMELFPASNEEQFTFIKGVIDDCDYYVLIVGGRYGSTTPEGLSYTEKEYDYALNKGLPVMSFIHEAPGSIPFDKSEADPALREKLDRFRDRAKTGKMVKMWKDPKDLPGAVTISLVHAMKTQPAVGWVRADQIAASDILSDLVNLQRRNGELEEQLRQAMPVVADLASLEDPVEFTGTHRSSNYQASMQWRFTVTWGQLFERLGPHILGCPNDHHMYSQFELALKELYRETGKTLLTSWTPHPHSFQRVKLQFIALNLAKVEMQPTTNGGQSLFWAPTDLGKRTLLALATAKAR
ncbi:hypothetical protein HDF16_000731 [Granulicella aggregans]|uniref:DUF4062 domain-containing protein n=1 Tax=Granulicella aggregans TaxID=474949 RepID=A0A7W7ZA88_9BACT|nr:DUF4062 domain-containing protein [Granulicella aggregans]MBB5056062.1 hypothetical protein [Granulicella aggregans]